MKKETIVIGAGMVGTSIAWHLNQRGHAVTLVDRKAPGEETSYGNAGLIQREAIYPHSFPRELSEILRILPNQSTDIRYRPGAMLHYASPLMQYWKNSAPERFEKIVKEWATLIEHCTTEHERMFTAAGAENLVRKVGWIQTHRSHKSWQEGLHAAEKAKHHGVEFKSLDREALQAEEPSLNASVYAGAIHWLNSWQVINPSALVKAYAKNFTDNGGTLQQSEIQAIRREGDEWVVSTSDGTLRAANLVVAAGPWSAQLLQPLGYNFPLFPLRGHHRHYKLAEGAVLNHSVIDNDKGFVLGPMQAGVRLTTGAEFALMTDPVRTDQITEDEKLAREIMPALREGIEPQPWFGSRPCMPDMKPVIGSAHAHQQLWLAFGHAHQGFTLGPATGRLVAEMMEGDTPYIDPQPFRSDRFA
ncbi:NAD(P)/FAD-dependent oxidoreductase [Paenalcaligenes sp. Me52]|uniref:NAD(P)/FAD-dependent oxidoreductase n=1 Tax=Paenalcaligenes sp. Me52 TaxID=3392038 RepID=UPI003D2DEC36